MPRIYDNIENKLSKGLIDSLKVAKRADFSIGYFNLRGWRHIAKHIDQWDGTEDNRCRILVGMQKLPQDELLESIVNDDEAISMDNQTAIRIKKQLAEEFKKQLIFGAPTNADERGLQQLANQLKDGKVIVKLYLRTTLHAKLYLLHRNDRINPIIGYLGSSNLTFSGLSGQGELNIDVLDYDASQKLSNWFEDRWNDRWCIDISRELIDVLENSWARDSSLLPYDIYMKMVYHLSEEAREGISKITLPEEIEDPLLEFQGAAVKIATHHLNKRNGVLIGDVVGLGKTMLATSVAKLYEESYGIDALIICPKNLIPMWEEYCEKYHLKSRIVSLSKVMVDLPQLKYRYRLVIIDESHHLRNREGKRYKAIQEYIYANDSKVILLTATPYNKSYNDMSNQLRLFISDDHQFAIRPEKLIQEIGETEFLRKYQCPMNSLTAFESSPHPEDWRELMRLYLIRRTRSFIIDNYAWKDSQNGRKYLSFKDGTRSYFPERIPKTLKFKIDEMNHDDQYAQLYSEDALELLNELKLPRYALGSFINKRTKKIPPKIQEDYIKDLSTHKHLMGFYRTNLYKRLESSGYSFIKSVKRHILRDYVILYAFENNKEIPIGSQSASLLEENDSDFDYDLLTNELDRELAHDNSFIDKDFFEKRAEEVYQSLISFHRNKFKWINSEFFTKRLKNTLVKDIDVLITLLNKITYWDPSKDNKLLKLHELVERLHPNNKVIVFTQFSDTANYIYEELKKLGTDKIECVTGASENPTDIVNKFSPRSNNKIPVKDELRILIATDVLSEGQNLQDSSIVVNYDLPWAIIRLIQRAGRVDRIGQEAENILCYSFMPAEGVEKVINLRGRIIDRLNENAEVVGTDEIFFDGDETQQSIIDLYNEKNGLLDENELEGDVDLSSYAYEIWKKEISKHPQVENLVKKLPPVVYSSKQHYASEGSPEGVLVYLRNYDGSDSIYWLDKQANKVTQSQYLVLKAAECERSTLPTKKFDGHHDLVKKALNDLREEQKNIGGQLGRPSGARFKTYERLKTYSIQLANTLFETAELDKVINEIYRAPLTRYSTELLNGKYRAGISNEELFNLVLNLFKDGKLCIKKENENKKEPVILCSLGLNDNQRGF